MLDYLLYSNRILKDNPALIGFTIFILLGLFIKMYFYKTIQLGVKILISSIFIIIIINLFFYINTRVNIINDILVIKIKQDDEEKIIFRNENDKLNYITEPLTSDNITLKKN